MHNFYERRKEELEKLFQSYHWPYYFSYTLCTDSNFYQSGVVLHREEGSANINHFFPPFFPWNDVRQITDIIPQIEGGFSKKTLIHRRCVLTQAGCSHIGNEIVKIV
jgi:hypothetical protein